jgi:hypothetical protein
MSAGVLVLAVVGSGCPKKDPPQCPTCPDPTPVVDAEKDGNVGFVATSSKGRVVVIPLDPRTRMFADGKEGTAGDLLVFAASGGGCPCRLPACWPYCRVADPVLSLEKAVFWGGTDVPAWPPVPDQPTAPATGAPSK